MEYSAYDLFMTCMHSNGIAFDVIKKALPVINTEIAKVLSNVVEFEVFFENNDNKYSKSQEIFASMRTAVINNSPTEQVPQFGEIRETGDEGGDFIFVRR